MFWSHKIIKPYINILLYNFLQVKTYLFENNDMYSEGSKDGMVIPIRDWKGFLAWIIDALHLLTPFQTFFTQLLDLIA